MDQIIILGLCCYSYETVASVSHSYLLPLLSFSSLFLLLLKTKRYHWYNIPVSDEVGNFSNPWEMLLRVVTKDDLVESYLFITFPSLYIVFIYSLFLFFFYCF